MRKLQKDNEELSESIDVSRVIRFMCKKKKVKMCFVIRDEKEKTMNNLENRN